MFGIDRQVYYRRKKRIANNKDIATQVIELIQPIRAKMPRIGTRKLYYLLETELRKLNIGRDKLLAILKANHMIILPKRSYRITTNTHHRFYKHKDLVNGLYINRPEQVWVSDITYIGNRGDNSYLALVTDAYSKKIVGYDLSNSLSVHGSLRALQMAIKARVYPSENLIHHSDKGVQYCCNEYQEKLIKNKITCSMTESYDPYSNAIAERVNGILKQEFNLEGYKVNRDILRTIVQESIDIYNRERPHLSCSYLTPTQMHNQCDMKIISYKKNSCKIELTTV